MESLVMGPERQRVGLGRALRGVLLALVSVGMAFLAFPPVGLWPLIFVAWAPMLVAQHGVLSARLSGLAMGIALGGYALVFMWGAPAPPVSWQEQLVPIAIAVPFGVAIAVMGWFDRRFHERTGYRWFTVATPLAWTGFEFLRGLLPLVGTWGWPANALDGQPWLIQPVSVLGTPALVLLVLLVNYSVAGLLLRRSARGLIAVSVVAAIWIAGSVALLESPERTLRVAAIQPGGFVGSTRLDAETQAAAAKGARLVVWPEDVLPYDPRGRRGAWVSQLARSTGAYLVVGHSRPGGDFSKATLFSPAGTALGTYAKEHPVVFQGEEAVNDGRFPVFSTAIGRIGMIICFDGAYTDSTRDVAREGAQIVALPAWDWPGIARTSNSLNVFRAVENRVAIVRAELAYDSAIIDPYGRKLANQVTPAGSAATLIADIPLGSGTSPWVTFGSWFGWLAAAWLAVYSLLCLTSTRSTPRSWTW